LTPCSPSVRPRRRPRTTVRQALRCSMGLLNAAHLPQWFFGPVDQRNRPVNILRPPDQIKRGGAPGRGKEENPTAHRPQYRAGRLKPRGSCRSCCCEYIRSQSHERPGLAPRPVAGPETFGGRPRAQEAKPDRPIRASAGRGTGHAGSGKLFQFTRRRRASSIVATTIATRSFDLIFARCSGPSNGVPQPKHFSFPLRHVVFWFAAITICQPASSMELIKVAWNGNLTGRVGGRDAPRQGWWILLGLWPAGGCIVHER